MTASGEIDLERSREIIALGAGRQLVFHRAFDVTPHPQLALDQLIDLGVTRVMTSGQEASAYNGAKKIRELIQRAGGRIEVLPAGGINRFCLSDVLIRTGCDQVHASLSTGRKDLSVLGRPQVSFGGVLRPPEEEFPVTDERAVSGLRSILG